MQVENTNIRVVNDQRIPKDVFERGFKVTDIHSHNKPKSHNLFPQQTSTNHHLPARFRKKPPSPLWRKSRTKALFILFAQFNLLFWRSCTRCVFERPPMHETVCYPMGKVCPLQDSLASFSDHAWIGRARIRTEVSTLLHGFVMFLCALMVLLFRNSVLAKCIGVATSMLLLRLQT